MLGEEDAVDVTASEPLAGLVLLEAESVPNPALDADLLVLRVALTLELPFELVGLKLRLRVGLGPGPPALPLGVDDVVDSGEEMDTDSIAVSDSVGDSEGDEREEAPGESACSVDVEGEAVGVPPSVGASGLDDSVMEGGTETEGVTDDVSLHPTEAEALAPGTPELMSVGDGVGEGNSEGVSGVECVEGAGVGDSECPEQSGALHVPLGLADELSLSSSDTKGIAETEAVADGDVVRDCDSKGVQDSLADGTTESLALPLPIPNSVTDAVTLAEALLGVSG